MPDAPEDNLAGLPSEWSESARETYAQIDDDNPRMTSAQRATLFECCGLLSLADDLAATIPTNGLMIGGSRGQLVVNPAIAEVRALRRDALAALRGLALAIPKDATAASRAASALVGARYGR
ncbi:hypothetical protein AB1K54_06210 [Microbacterium sp. BWT-B31]|uniref:hypothetical protein n=1 Tax=Microbacterium sp. BWT-B31 TaxID=3232072 RepID=UPI00352712EE